VSETRPDIAIINAYVDGELEAADAAGVAEAIAADSQLASMVANLHAMKSAVGDAFNTSEVIAVTPQKPYLSRASLMALAASLVVAVIGSGLWYGLSQRNTDDVISQALLQHDNWLVKPQAAQNGIINAAALITPDLTPAGLTLAGVQKNIPLGDTFGQRYAYVGTRGCKLSLFVSERDHAFEGIGNTARPDALIVKWAVANRGFLLVARNMNQERFRVIAKALEAATARAVALDEPMRLAMLQTRKPCGGKKVS